MRRLFPPRSCEHPVSSLLAVRIPEQWHVEAVCQACQETVRIPTGTLLAVRVRDARLVDSSDPQDVGGIAHVMEVMRESA
jgi:hypothetical protein